MAVLRLLLRASFRQRWRSWLALGLLLLTLGATVLVERSHVGGMLAAGAETIEPRRLVGWHVQ